MITSVRQRGRQGVMCLVQGTLALMLMPAIALAHGAQVQARITAAVEVLAAYDSGKPMATAQVQVYGPDDPQTPVFSGTTDDTGRYVFVPTRPGDWEVSVRQAGHGDITVVSVTEAGTVAAETMGARTASAGALSPLQRGIMAGAVTWGCVGTALYFWRGKR